MSVFVCIDGGGELCLFYVVICLKLFFFDYIVSVCSVFSSLSFFYFLIYLYLFSSITSSSSCPSLA